MLIGAVASYAANRKRFIKELNVENAQSNGRKYFKHPCFYQHLKRPKRKKIQNNHYLFFNLRPTRAAKIKNAMPNTRN